MASDAGVADYDSSTGKAIPEGVHPEPNLATLRHYFSDELVGRLWLESIGSEPSSNPQPVPTATSSNAFLEKEMATSGLVSYLFYDDGNLIYDEISSKDRLGRYVNDSTHLKSNSIAKSWTSYLLGHAICEGKIASVTARLKDWPLLEDTLYEGQRIIDLINMRAGDQHVATEDDGMRETGRWFSTASLSSFADRELAGTEPARREYNYSMLSSKVILNYLIYKYDYQSDLLDKVFTEKVRAANAVTFEVIRGVPIEYGSATVVGWASRYDYLRIAISMLEDWNNDTCVGQYLKRIHQSSERISNIHPRDFRLANVNGYGGFFHTHLRGMRDRHVLYMDGYGGQAVMIDFDNNRIVSVNAAHDNYDWDALVYDPIRYGDIREE